MERHGCEKIRPACYAAVAVTVLAPFLHGSTRLWAEAAITIGVGGVFLLFPPAKSLGLVPSLGSVSLLLLSGAAFLPARWFPTPEFRTELGKIGVQLPATLSAQPWRTLESSLLFCLCLSWAYYLLSADWTLVERRRSWFLIGTAVTALAAMVTVAYALGERIPFWPNDAEFGFFPNRNHTSNVLGLGGILVYATALNGFKERQKSWWIWLGALALVCPALVIVYSRAGIVLILAGTLTWNLSWLVTSRDRRLPLIASGMLILMLALFAWSGGRTATRFADTGNFFFPSQNVRLLIYRDAINLSLREPIAGIGSGNFSAVFATKSHDFLKPSIAGHPESDWLWSAVELGWPATLLIASLFAWWASRCFRFEHRTLRLMRLAAFIAVCGFALHAFFDVPAHQIGALWPALFLASTAVHPALLKRFCSDSVEAAEDGRPHSTASISPSSTVAADRLRLRNRDWRARFDQAKAASIVFRLLGIFFIAVGIWWFASVLSAQILPTSAGLRRSLQEIESARIKEDYQTMLERASKALQIAPLNWELYFKRGFAEAAMHQSRSETLRDFAAARYLLPDWPDLYLKEGTIWLGVGERDLAFDVWKQGMRHLPEIAPSLYADIFGLIKSDPDLRDEWRKLSESDKRCLLEFLHSADSTEFELELQQMMVDGRQLQNFTPEELETLFTLWYDKGDRLWLAQTLQEHSEWKKMAWRRLARVYAEYGDYRQAFETADQFLPQTDNTESAVSSGELALRFRSNPADAGAGEALALALAREDKIDGALLTLRAIRDLPGSPKYLPALEARLWAKKQDWKRAWNAVEPLVSAGR